MTLVTRPFAPPDRSDCLALFDGNLPRFFAPEERADFDAFLRALADPQDDYLVLLHEEEIVACGGLSREEGAGRLVWGMVARDLHHQGIGTALLEARLAQARRLPGVAEVRLATSQHSAGFYESFGFVVTGLQPEGFGPGIDRLDMVLKL